ncbi:MAG: cytochrome b/b6 domain-containing protein [Candidatus Kapaibacterium sp.]
MRKALIYRRFERFWHWMQAVLVIVLILTGFEIHGFYTIFGFGDAVELHNLFAYGLIILTAFAIFWHFTTGEWRQYVPTRNFLREYISFYMKGVFRGEPHPTKKTELSKLNPLQRITYLMLKLFLFPVQIGTGLLYMYYYVWKDSGGFFSLETVATLHLIGSYLFVTFLVAHLYLMTTGHSVGSNLKAMITGYEDIEDESEPKEQKA